MLPTFLICGIQKGGTTFLFHLLRRHPQVFMPGVKEVNFFSVHYERGLDWYKAHFASAKDKAAIGEASPLYMWHPQAAPRIAKVLPDCTLIFVLRNPIDRAYSNYWFNVSRGAQNPKVGFSEAVRTDEGHWRYVSKGLYMSQIERFTASYSQDSMLFILTDDLRDESAIVAKRSYSFLRVDENFQPNETRMRNVTRVPLGRFLGDMYYQWARLKPLLARLVPSQLVRPAAPLRNLTHGILFSGKARPPIREQDRRYLRRLFQHDLDQLAEFIQRDLSHWK